MGKTITIQTKIGKLHRKLDKQIQQSVTGNCEACGGRASVLHHFVYKAHSTFLRYNERNLIKLCTKCHFILHHKGGIESKIVHTRGTKWLDWIESNRRTLVKRDKFYLEHLEKLLEEFEN